MTRRFVAATIIVIVLLTAGAVVFVLLQDNASPSATDQASQPVDVSKDSGDAKSSDRPLNWSTMNEGPYRDQISFATGADLVHWTDTGRTLATHASVPGAVLRDGELFLYFVDVSQDGIPERIGLLRSTDNGTTWSDKTFITVDGVGSHVPVDPAPVLLDDGRIRLYYIDIDEAGGPISHPNDNAVYSAISEDGVTFVQEEGERYSAAGIFDPDVINVNGAWKLVVGDIEGNRVLIATSTDGVTFTAAGTAYTGGAVPDIEYAGGTYYLLTAGITIATSSTGETFQGEAGHFQSTIGQVTADPSVVQLPGGMNLLFYKTNTQHIPSP